MKNNIILKSVSLLCLILLVIHQTQGNCVDINQLCREHVEATMPYECDKSCTSFVVCYTLIEKRLGLLKTCPTGMYYSSTNKMCLPHKSKDCL